MDMNNIVKDKLHYVHPVCNASKPTNVNIFLSTHLTKSVVHASSYVAVMNIFVPSNSGLMLGTKTWSAVLFWTPSPQTKKINVAH